MSVLKVSNYLLEKMDYLSRIKSDNSSKILSYVSDKDYELMQKLFAIIYRNSIVH